jgi:uncharacterized membrane protein
VARNNREVADDGLSYHRSWCCRSQRSGDALYQSRFVDRLICPIFKDGCEGVADAPFAHPFGIPDGYIGAALYALISVLLLAPSRRWIWVAALVLSGTATLANIVGVRDMMNLGSFCFYCLLTTLLSPVLIWAMWELK